MNKVKLLFAAYIAGIISLFFYSFTQVDLSLTLSKSSLFQAAEKNFQYLGFFQRPLSAIIFSAIMLLLFVSYIFLLYFAKKGIIKIKHVFVMTIITFIILVFSYNAFSYDLFNYIFDAKIITHYYQNPYLHKAADFANDPMLNFMRWTHRVYPYGPSWLVLTVPLSLIDLGFFLPAFFLFKLLMGFSFLGSSILIYKISEKLFPNDKIFNFVFWAFNPFILTECLVSAHNDGPMIFFLLLSIYLYLQKKKLLSWISNIFSVGIKFSTGALLPLFLVLEYFDRTKKKINWEIFFTSALVLSLTTVIFATIRTTFQPWYLIFPLSLSSFLSKRYYILIPAILISIFSMSLYVIYVYMTDYAKEYPSIIQNIQLVELGVVLIYLLGYFFKSNFFHKH